MTRTGRWVLGIALALAASVPSVAAGKLEPPELGRYFRWGPFRLRPGLVVSDVGYDDNILASTTNRVGDYTATVAPKVEGLVLFGHRAFLTFEERLEYTSYASNSSQNFRNERGSARVTVPWNKIGVFVDGVLNRVEDRPIDQLDTRPQRDRGSLGFGLILLPSAKTEVEISRSRTNWDYFDVDDPALPQRLDRKDRRTALAASYELVGRTRVTLDTYRQSTGFRDPVSAGKNAESWSVAPGVDFGVGGRLSGSARFGWTTINSEGPDVPDVREPVTDLELSYRPGRSLTLRLTALRQPGLSLTENVYYINARRELRAIYYFNRTVGVESGTSFGRLSYPDANGDDERVDKIDSYDVGVRLRLAPDSLGRRLEYGLKVQRWRRVSSDPGLDLSRTRVGLGLILGF